jgi:hypothetical protein
MMLWRLQLSRLLLHYYISSSLSRRLDRIDLHHEQEGRETGSDGGNEEKEPSPEEAGDKSD